MAVRIAGCVVLDIVFAASWWQLGSFSPRSAHAMVAVNQYMIVFGGFSNGANTEQNDRWFTWDGADCRTAPFCPALLRLPCAVDTDTCGSCFSGPRAPIPGNSNCSSKLFVWNFALSLFCAALITDCSHAPNCTALHRAACFDVANTCGPCQPGFMGDQTFNGYGNTVCLGAFALSIVRLGCRWQVCGSTSSLLRQLGLAARTHLLSI